MLGYVEVILTVTCSMQIVLAAEYIVKALGSACCLRLVDLFAEYLAGFVAGAS